jgi:predicted dehydrogenase
MTEKLRWGVLSTANIGRVAVNPAIRISSNGVLRAVASRDEDRAREFARQHEIPVWHGSYDAMLDDDTIDAIYVPLPNSMHREWCIRAAEHGKHVLCEKPLALTAEECHEMDSAARTNRTTLMEAFMYRFHPRTRKVVELINAGVIGELRFIRSAFTFRLTRLNNIRLLPDLGGGALMDVGCYCVNISRTVTDAEPVEVQAFARWHEGGVDDTLAATMRFADGVIAQFDCSLGMERRESYEVAGTDGSLDVPGAFLPGAGDVVIHERHGRGEQRDHVVPGDNEYRLMVEHFADCALHGRSLRYSVADAAGNMAVIEALYRSAREGGRPTPVSQVASVQVGRRTPPR